MQRPSGRRLCSELGGESTRDMAGSRCSQFSHTVIYLCGRGRAICHAVILDMPMLAPARINRLGRHESNRMC